ncbi:hypothetical protein OHA74_54295 [Streptomyces phaeochromogenes]|uniref:hypothetical protein n=1 Tax=Streptomyces phaeochromogenes TaxID=1923 RepID=UPI002E293B1D|nr:hypothetical protein [Streptomyces phaeochromogenes]
MTTQGWRVPRHLLVLVGLTVLLAAVMGYPFLPGSHDLLSLLLSTVVHAPFTVDCWGTIFGGSGNDQRGHKCPQASPTREHP